MAAASAPGKLVLSGEYTVLDGAPALVMAVDRRAVARHAGGRAAPGADPGGLVDAVLRVTGPAEGRGAVVLDTEAFHRSHGGRPVKLGLGSSAALAAALCRLLLPPGATVRAVLEAAVAAHRDFQSGRGSGVDVAASVVGGLLSYRMQGAAVECRRWPQALSRSVWWSGVPARTADRLAAWSRAGASAERSALACAADDLAAAWGQEDDEAALAALATYSTVLAAFDRRHELGIFAAGHGELAAAGEACGVVYKPCGAGGGDVGMAVSVDAPALERFAAAATARGFVELPLAIDLRGAELDDADS